MKYTVSNFFKENQNTIFRFHSIDGDLKIVYRSESAEISGILNSRSFMSTEMSVLDFFNEIENDTLVVTIRLEDGSFIQLL